MQEEHRLAMRADLGLAVAEHPRATSLEPVAGGHDIIDLVAHVMDAAGWVLVEEAPDRGRLAEHPEQLDLSIGQGDEDGLHTMRGLVLDRRDGGAEDVPVLPR